MLDYDKEILDKYWEKYNSLIEGKKGTEDIIPLLKEIQEKEGYLPKEIFVLLSESLGVPMARLYGIATFYNLFKLEKSGKYKISVCEGTACHVRGSPALLDTIMNILKIQPGEVTKDGRFSLEIVRCLGLCASAPVMTINDKVYAKVSPDMLKGILEECK